MVRVRGAWKRKGQAYPSPANERYNRTDSQRQEKAKLLGTALGTVLRGGFHSGYKMNLALELV